MLPRLGSLKMAAFSQGINIISNEISQVELANCDSVLGQMLCSKVARIHNKISKSCISESASYRSVK